MNHFVKNNPQRPDIAFGCVLSSLENLGGHINGTTNAGFKHLRSKVINILSKAKIPNFIDTLIDKDVGWFQIAMNDFFSH